MFLPHKLCLGARKHLCVVLIELQLSRNRSRGLLGIARHHADLGNTQGAKSLHNLRRFLANRVKDAYDRAELAVDCKIQSGILIRQRLKLLLILL